MKRLTVAALALLVIGVAPAGADIIITPGPAPNPGLNLQFPDDEGLLDNATLIQGITNQGDFIVDIESDEELVSPSSGQARVEADDGGFDDATFTPNGAELWEAFFANLFFGGGQVEGSATVTACNQLGDPCESVTFDIGPGQNFFLVSVVSPQLISSVTVETTIDLEDIRQIRLDVAGFEPIPTPEPTTAAVLGLGLLATGILTRKRA